MLILSNDLKTDREDGAENTTHLKITFSLQLEINYIPINLDTAHGDAVALE